MSHYPDLREFLASEKEQVLILKRSIRSIIGHLITAFISVLVFLLLFYFVDSSVLPISIFWLLLVPVGILLEAARQYHDDLYIFEKERIIREGGRLSLHLSVPSIHYADIRAISVIQSIWGRIFKYGTVELNTAAQDANEVALEGILYPDEVALLVDDLKRHLRNSLLQKGVLMLPEDTDD